ncbi:MAG: HPr family phosphocarrier protein [Clostridia bacterium]|nr:HPr family phosphocarrier protein [Clostridia bacterium]
MKSFTFTITDPEGFHARPAGGFVKEAKKFPCVSMVVKNGRRADACKMFGLMGLGIQRGETITVTTEGEQEEEAAIALQEYLEANL